MQIQLLSLHSHNKMPKIKNLYYALSKNFIIRSPFSSTLLFSICTLSISPLSTSFSMYISFSFVWFSSFKIKFSSWFDSPIFYQNIIFPEGEIRNKYFCAKIIFYQLYENKLKHLRAIERKINVTCSKNT